MSGKDGSIEGGAPLRRSEGEGQGTTDCEYMVAPASISQPSDLDSQPPLTDEDLKEYREFAAFRRAACRMTRDQIMARKKAMGRRV